MEDNKDGFCLGEVAFQHLMDSYTKAAGVVVRIQTEALGQALMDLCELRGVTFEK